MGVSVNLVCYVSQERPAVDPKELSNLTYTKDLVRRLLPAIWDRHFLAESGHASTAKTPYDYSRRAHRMRSEDHTAWAWAIDVRRAWKHAPLTKKQRQAVVVCGGLDLEYTEAGDVLGVAPNTAQVNFERGLEHLLDHMTGSDSEHTP